MPRSSQIEKVPVVAGHRAKKTRAAGIVGPGAPRSVETETVGAEQEQVHQREAAVAAGQNLVRGKPEPLGAETSGLRDAVAPAVAAGVGTVLRAVTAVEEAVERGAQLELIAGGLAAREIEVQPLGLERGVAPLQLRLGPSERGIVRRVDVHVSAALASRTRCPRHGGRNIHFGQRCGRSRAGKGSGSWDESGPGRESATSGKSKRHTVGTATPPGCKGLRHECDASDREPRRTPRIRDTPPHLALNRKN